MTEKESAVFSVSAHAIFIFFHFDFEDFNFIFLSKNESFNAF